MSFFSIVIMILKIIIFYNNFYAELVRFWADFRNAFSEKDSRGSIIWNNKDVRID